jgi:hypothetical protein
MQTTTEMTWILLVFVLLVSFAHGGAIGDSPLVWGSALFLDIPFMFFLALSNSFPLLAPLFILALLYYFVVVLEGGVGQGYTVFVVASVIIMMVGA